MPGKGSQKRYHAQAMRIARLRAEKFTTRQISDITGVAPERIKAMVQLGQRLLAIQPGDHNDVERA